MNTLFDVVRPTMPTSTGRGFLTKLIGENTYKWLNSLYKIIIRGGGAGAPFSSSSSSSLSLSLSLSSPWSAVPPLIMILYRLLSHLYVFFPINLVRNPLPMNVGIIGRTTSNKVFIVVFFFPSSLCLVGLSHPIGSPSWRATPLSGSVHNSIFYPSQ
jgi:hypothetical protein